MRHALALLVVFCAGAAQASPRIVAIGPAGDSPEAQQLRSKLPGMLVGGCGFAMARLDTPCNDMRCAADAVLGAKADMVLESRLAPDGDGQSSLTMILSTGQGMDITGSTKTTLGRVGDGLARICQQAAPRMNERSLEAAPSAPLTSTEIEAAQSSNVFELYRCAERAWTGAEKKAERGEPIVLDWLVRADGTATAATVTSPAQSGHSTASECFARVIDGWKFPTRSRAEVQRGYRLLLDPANAPPPPAPTTLPATLSKEDIAKGLKANVEKLGPCVTTAKNNKEIKPARHTFVLNWYVLPTGNTTDPKVVGPPEIMRTTLRACFEKVMLGWTFRPTKEGAAITNFPLPVTVR